MTFSRLGNERAGRVTRRAALAAVPVVALPAAACGGGKTETAAPSGAPVELRLHGGTDGAQGDYWPKVASGFNSRQSKIHVTFEPWLPDKGPLVLAAAGTLGDVMRLVTASEYSQVAAKGVLKDLAPLVSRDKYDLKQFYAAAVD